MMKFILLIACLTLSLSGIAQTTNSSRAQKYIDARESQLSLAAVHDSFISNMTGLDSIDELPHKYPHLPFLKQEIKSFSSGRQYLKYTVDDLALMQNNAEFKDFLDNTVEVIFYPSGPYGHIRLRVGAKLYGFEFFNNSLVADYSLRLGSNKEGFIFFITKQKIHKMQGMIEAFYVGSTKYNLPGFDAGGSKMKIITEGNSLRYQSTRTDSYGNHQAFLGKIITSGNKKFIQNPDGLKLKLTEKNGDLWAQGYSCASSATYVLKKYLGVDIKNINYAKSLRKYLAGGNKSGATPVIARIDYLSR